MEKWQSPAVANRSAFRRNRSTAASAALFVRAYMLKLFHRDDGQAADWLVIAETLLLEAFHALDQMPHSPRKLLRRVEGGVYARLTAIPDDPYVDKYLREEGLDRAKRCDHKTAGASGLPLGN
jgi:hypothetical protein